MLMSGKTVRGSIEGDSVPKEFIPQMITYFEQGLMPLDKLVETYAFDDINTAINAAVSGAVIKPVLLM
ncbi:MAG TPA: hypothetical protein DIW43_14560 [Spongiibacteraceae bacterium]|nr:hypothetical protein [Spongiibacteraceae bacterium]